MDVCAITDRQRRSLRSRSASQLQALGTLLQHSRRLEANEILVNEGAMPTRVFLITDGWAIRYKTLADGRRQILDFLLPGDMTGLFSVLFDQTDCGVQALTPLSIRSAGASRIITELNRSQQLAVTLSWLAGSAEQRMDEQLLRVGRRSAEERMAHLFMELHRRLRRNGLQDSMARRLPLTQKAVADHLGMSQVHANRTFRGLVRRGVVALRDGVILLLDLPELARVAGFEDAYLDHTPPAPVSPESSCA
jgi:CRP-like cAMP-binding protein